MYKKPIKRRKQLTLSTRCLWEFCQLDPLLREIVGVGFDEAPSVRLWISSIHRTDVENKAAGAKSRIHVVGPPYRSVDGGWVDMTQAEVDKVCDEVNSRYRYDPNRPRLNVAYGKQHGTGLHIHYQVHPNTIRITPNE